MDVCSRDGTITMGKEVCAASTDEVVCWRDVELCLDVGAIEVIPVVGVIWACEGGELKLVP